MYLGWGRNRLHFALADSSDAMLLGMSNSELPELEEIKQFVLDSLPEGYQLDSVNLTVGTIYEGQEPAFTVLINISSEPDVPSYGMGYDISARIREKWSRDDLYIKINWVERLE